MKTDWICTDPAVHQWGRKIGKRFYEFKQDIIFPDNTVEEEHLEINLNNFTEEEINDHLSAYGWSIEQLKEENSLEDAEWLMAECIFEQTVY